MQQTVEHLAMNTSTLSRRECLSLLAASSLAPVLARAAENPGKRPNILWLISEDMGPAVACYGQKQVTTPNLDRLAREGVRYDRFYTTCPVCSPSRSAFMTGMYATTISAHHHRSNRGPGSALPEGVRLITHWMRDAGYYTGNITALPPECGFKGTGKTDWNFATPPRPFDTSNWADLKPNQPFFAQINFAETHRMGSRWPQQPIRYADPAKVEVPSCYPDHPVIREDYARYLDSATELDRKIGLVMQQLEKDGLADDTIIIFMGDNGESHIRGKQFCYEEGLRVPAIIRWARSFPAPMHFSPGTGDERLLLAIDIAPTLLSLAGAPIPPRMQGQVFLGSNAAPPRDHVVGARDRCDETAMRIRTVRDRRYRYIRNFTPERPFFSPNDYKARHYPAWTLIPRLHEEGRLTPAQAALCAPRLPDEELYDMQADPHQVNNLAGAPEHQAALLRLRQALEQWIRDTDDRGRFPEDRG
jgi:N-sulfoglucosamine sulfohydrolase